MFDLDFSLLANVLFFLSFLLVSQVTIPSAPTVVCGFGRQAVAVVATYRTTYEGKPIPVSPVSGATVEFRGVPVIWPLTREVESKSTNILGLAETCVLSAVYVEAWIRKDGIDFGNGVGQWRWAGTSLITASPQFWKVEAVTLPPGFVPPVLPPVVVPCVGRISSDVPNIPEMLSRLTVAPTSILVPVYTEVNGVRTDVPLDIYVDYRKITSMIGNRSMDIINVFVYGGIDKSVSHVVELRSTRPDCNIPSASFTVPALVPGVVVPTCRELATKVDSVSVPDILPTVPTTPFFIYLRGIKEFCSDDPTNPAFIKKITGRGTIYLGNLSASFDISDGVADFDLSKLVDLSGLVSTAVPVVAPLPVAVAPPVALPLCEKTGRIGQSGYSYGDMRAYLVSLADVQSFLSSCYPGGSAELAPPEMPTWWGAFRIWRGAGGRYPAGTYFWAIKWEDIRGTY